MWICCPVVLFFPPHYFTDLQEERSRSEHNLLNIQKTHERMQTENKSESMLSACIILLLLQTAILQLISNTQEQQNFFFLQLLHTIGQSCVDCIPQQKQMQRLNAGNYNIAHVQDIHRAKKGKTHEKTTTWSTYTNVWCSRDHFFFLSVIYW